MDLKLNKEIFTWPVPHTGSFKSGFEGGGGSPDMFQTPTNKNHLQTQKQEEAHKISPQRTHR